MQGCEAIVGFLCEVSWLVEQSARLSWLVEQSARCALENLQNVGAGVQQRFHSLQSTVNEDWTHAGAWLH
jgi:hypothetical protein